MPKQQINLDQKAAQTVAEDIDSLARKVADIRGTSYSTANLTPEQELWGWMYRDPKVNKAALIAGGVPPIDAEFQERPLKKWLISQAGTKWDEVKRYCDRMALREQEAIAKGRLPKAPTREQLQG